MPDRPHVLVVGSGIIGASIAYHLQRDDARVSIIEAGQVGGLATRHSWAWINASWGNPEPYFRLRHHSMKLWRELGKTLPDLRVNWCGGLLWDAPAEELNAYVTQHRAWGYDIRTVARDKARRIEPQLATVPAFAVHVPEEGVVEPVAAAKAFLAAAQALGTELITGRKVTAMDVQAGRVIGIVTDQGRIAADEVVIAAGTATPELTATAGVTIPLSAPPGLLAVTNPQPKLLNGLVMAPQMHIRQQPDGRLIAGADFGGSELAEGDGEEAAKVAALSLLDMMRGFFAASSGLALDHYTIGHRPTPADGYPAIGRTPGIDGLSLAVTHSGITLAPVIGAALSAEIRTGKREPLLALYRPERFS
ncbi:MAG TPA: FAD-binding oxidoreductase [Terriglobales bacterium]|nr:FAD-binding oxidoreductase [Terriglobales bacterium]